MPASPFPDADDSHEAAGRSDASEPSGDAAEPSAPPSDGGSPDEALDLDGVDVNIPDDASALESDRLRYLEERARGQGHDAGPDWSVREPGPVLPAIFRTRRWHRFGLSGPLVVAVLLAVAIMGSLMTILRPDVSSAPTPLPLSAPVDGTESGTVGALMPDTAITLDGVPLSLRRLRPVVAIVVPDNCATCSGLVSDLATQAREQQIRTVLVGDLAQLDQLRALSTDAARGAAGVVVDTEGALTARYSGPGPTIMLVHADGVISDVISDPTTTARLGPALESLGRPGAGSTPS